MGRYDDIKKMVYDCIITLVNEGYVQGTGGNISMLIDGEDLLAVTPSQIEYNAISYKDICIVDFDLNTTEKNSMKPSMETGMHIAIYKNRLDVSAVVHTHQVYASIFSLINEPIPALFDEVAMSIGTEIEVIPYGLSGSTQLAENVTSKLGNSANCYIIQNHGALALAATLNQAKRNAELMEKTARVYFHAMTTGKEITLLPEKIQQLMKKSLAVKQHAEIERKNNLQFS